MRTHAMGEMTVKEIREYLKTNQTIILPYGVVEQHGYHLPLSMDIHNAEVPSYALAEKLGCIVAPPLNYCFSGGQLPGTINVRPTTFCAMVCDIVESLANQGFLNILIFPGHGGTESLDQLRESLRILKWLNPALEKVMIMILRRGEFWQRPKEPGMTGSDFHAGIWFSSTSSNLTRKNLRKECAMIRTPTRSAQRSAESRRRSRQPVNARKSKSASWDTRNTPRRNAASKIWKSQSLRWRRC